MGYCAAFEARKRGLLIRPIGNVVVLTPPLATPQRTLSRMVSILYHSSHPTATS